MTPESPETPGDKITGNVGEGAQNVAVGKNIVQIIIDKLHLPQWLLYSLAVSLVVTIGSLGWFGYLTLVPGIPVVLPPTPIPTLTPIPLSTALPFMPEQAGEVLIVIATFDRGEGVADARPHAEIQRSIQEEAEALAFANLRVEVEPAALAADDRAGAEALGERYNTSLVIWGEESSVRITVNFLNRKEPDFDAAAVQITETERTFLTATAKPEAYVQFVTSELPGQLTFLTLFAVGQSFVTARQNEKATATIEHALAAALTTQVEGIASAYFLLGWLYQKISADREAAILAYTHAIDRNPVYVPAYINRGITYYYLRESEQALADYDRAIAIDPDDARAYNNRGLVYVGLGEYAKALVDYDRAIDLDPDDPSAYNNRGLVYTELGEYAQALAEYDRSIAIDPGFAGAYNNRGTVYQWLDEYKQALADYDHAIALDASFAVAYISRGNAYGRLGEYAQALIDYDRAIALDPDYVAVYNNRGLAYARLGEYEQAIVDYDRAIVLDPDKPDYYANRGNAYAGLGKYKQSIADHDRAIALDPNYASAYNNRGLVYVELGEYAQAIANYDQALSLDPDDTAAYNNRGIAHYALGKYDLAITDYGQALVLAPGHVNAFNNRGIAYAHLGEYDKALADFHRYTELAPADQKGWNQVCWWGSLTGFASTVLNACDKAVRISTQHPQILDSRGLARALTGDAVGAIEDFTAYVEWSKKNGLYEPYGKKREAWIAVLKRGENPFDEATLAELWEE